MENNALNALRRTNSGKGTARELRRLDRVPAVYYYSSDVNIPLSIDLSDLQRLLKANPSLIDLCVEGEEPHECVLREIQRDPVDETILHIDLMGIKRGTKLIVTVPVRLVGLPVGVKTGGGILQYGLTELDVECLPKNIPTVIEVDVSSLEIGQTVHLGDLDYPDLTFQIEEKVVLANVVPPSVIKEPVPEEVEAEEAEAAEEEETKDEAKETEGADEKGKKK